jgi:hypothetical protein
LCRRRDSGLLRANQLGQRRVLERLLGDGGDRLHALDGLLLRHALLNPVVDDFGVIRQRFFDLHLVQRVEAAFNSARNSCLFIPCTPP